MHEGRLNTGHDGLLDNFKAVVCRLKGFEALLLEEVLQPDEKHNFVACRVLSHRTVADSACTANEGSTAVDAHGPAGNHDAKNKLYLGQYTAYTQALLALYRSL